MAIIVSNPSAGGGASGVSSFNTRTGAVSLTKADVTSTGLAASDVGADASGAAAAVSATLGTAATKNVGTTTGTVAAGDDSRITGAVAASTATTKGDLLVATGSAAISRVGVGSDALALVASSGQSSGVKWASPETLKFLYTRPTGVKYETIPRILHLNTTTTLTSGTLLLVALVLPANEVISTIWWTSASTGATSPTHWWFGLYDNNRNQLAVTADQTTTAWAATTTKTLNIATTAAGAASSFTTTYEGLHYLGLMMAATTPINLCAGGQGGNLGLLSPTMSGGTDTSQTTPPAFPHQAASISNIGTMPWGAVG